MVAQWETDGGAVPPLGGVLPGTIGLTPIAGDVGKLIRLGQWLNGDGFADWQHAFILLNSSSGSIIEAEPGGARTGNVSEYSHIYWCENIATAHKAALNNVVSAALGYVGTPYSFADYVALAQRRLHLPTLGVREYVADTGHMICSQLCARSYYDAKASLYTEWTGYVDPLDLYNLDRSLAR